MNICRARMRGPRHKQLHNIILELEFTYGWVVDNVFLKVTENQ